jgi:hypothetical protein
LTLIFGQLDSWSAEIDYTSFKKGFTGTWGSAPLNHGTLYWNEDDHLILAQNDKNYIYNLSAMSIYCRKEMTKVAGSWKRNKLEAIYQNEEETEYRTIGYLAKNSPKKDECAKLFKHGFFKNHRGIFFTFEVNSIKTALKDLEKKDEALNILGIDID